MPWINFVSLSLPDRSVGPSITSWPQNNTEVTITLKWFVFLVAGYFLLTGVLANAETDPFKALHKEQLADLSAYGEGVAEALEGMGKRVASRMEPNTHVKNALDEIYTDYLSGISISWLKPGPIPEKRILHSMSISRGNHPIVERLRIGIRTEASITNQYGAPAKRTASVITYYVPAHIGVVMISFQIKSGILESIDWVWPIE